MARRRRSSKIKKEAGFTLSDLLFLVALICVGATIEFSSMARGMIRNYTRAAQNQISGYGKYFQLEDDAPAPPPAPNPAVAAIARVRAQSMPSYNNFNSMPSPRPGPERVQECFPACGSALPTL